MRVVRLVLMSLASLGLMYYLVEGPGVAAVGLRWALLPALGLYLLSHGLRALRIFLLLYDGKLRASQTLLAHVHAAGVSLLIPWKLGEIYRIVVFQGLSPSFRRVLMAVWVERIWDTGALLLLLLLPLIAGVSVPVSPTLVLVMVVFLTISALLFVVLPENIILVKRYLIVRQRSEQALWSLIWVDRIHTVLTCAYRQLCYRVATMAWITLGIWGLELAGLRWALAGTTHTAGAMWLLPGSIADQLSWPVPWMDQATVRLVEGASYHHAQVLILVSGALVAGLAIAVNHLSARAAIRQNAQQSHMHQLSNRAGEGL